MENLKKLKDLDIKELKEIFSNNEKLEHLAREELQEMQMIDIEDIISKLKSILSSWSVGYCNRDSHCYIKQLDYNTINVILEVNQEICFINDEDIRIIKEFEKLLDIENALEPDEEGAREKIAEELEQAEKEINKILRLSLENFIEYSNYDLDDFFISFYVDNREDLYINDNQEIFIKQPEYIRL